jgi:hypothetical protein
MELIEHGIKSFDIRILIMIKSRLHQNFRHQDPNLAVLILELGISSDRLVSHHQLVYRSILELEFSSD